MCSTTAANCSSSGPADQRFTLNERATGNERRTMGGRVNGRRSRGKAVAVAVDSPPCSEGARRTNTRGVDGPVAGRWGHFQGHFGGLRRGKRVSCGVELPRHHAGSHPRASHGLKGGAKGGSHMVWVNEAGVSFGTRRRQKQTAKQRGSQRVGPGR